MKIYKTGIAHIRNPASQDDAQAGNQFSSGIGYKLVRGEPICKKILLSEN